MGVFRTDAAKLRFANEWLIFDFSTLQVEQWSLGPLGLVPATGLLFFRKKCASHHFFCHASRALEEKRPVRRYCLDVRR